MEMPHAMGLDVAKRIQPDVGNIVFVTAHSHYSLEAFETAVDYILKPITPKRLQQALAKVESLVPVKVQQEQKIKLLLKGTFRELPEIDIAFLRGQRNYTEVVLTNGEHHLMARTLKSFTDVLSDGFVRIHKSIVVQRALIASIQPGNPAHVLLIDGTQLDAAKARLKALGNDV
jgi:two-component system LytT family response regulator